MMTMAGRASLALALMALVGLAGAPARAGSVVLAQYFESLGDEESGEGNSEDSAPSLEGLEVPGLEGDVEGAEPSLRPDLKSGADRGAPPQSAGETKQNKLDLELGDLPVLDPAERPKMLAELYDKLGQARSPKAAEPITKAIEELWAYSGSDTVDLLMSRASQFVKEEQIDLSLSILDAIVDIAPDEAEAWYLRAKVNVLNGKPERALSDLRRALNLDEKHYMAIQDLGIVLEQLGAKKEALEAYRRALAVNPFLDESRQGVEALKREVEGQDI